ncbi:MAG: NADH dehydrogenase (quinone) subunit D [Nitrospira sp.]|jgi:NADH dehydrogenase I D subunit|nr:NADH dehydrogenase (quinone) subunit D [Nitrospira sp.]MDW7654572.1 NADH dehydrogenase (quinone) subunit D [Nitrospiraceae bacterium]PHX91256.1 MAG: NADH-quinone oxidoreductase subunit D [Nitrospirota bacterium]MBP0121801.1 NADH dehydrogenase (quinone) subunit D [Nitrospira sp.]MBP0124634.1 NADH dehydrogenase (quinone) subunit D [Nitrospira sp.]
MQVLLDNLKAKFPDAILAVHIDAARAETSLSVAAPRLLDLARYLHDAPEAAFDQLTDICSVDYPEDQLRFEVVYHLHSLPLGQRLRLKTRITEDDPTIASVTSIWKGGEFLEREVYDMMGIRFSGHPDLRRILMPEDYAEGYPLRKDFPTEGRGWRSEFDFIPRMDDALLDIPENEIPEEQKNAFRAEPGLPSSRRKEELLLNMGPQHPSTHGVLRVVLELDGERIVKATPDLGYLHRGVEKLAEGLTYMQIIPHTDRLDYVCAMANNYAYVRSVEKLLDITVPVRAEYIRTIVAEMQRIIGHLFWLGTQALDIGAMTVFFWTFREREILLDMFEKLCGARLTLNYYRIGGVDSDFTPELVQQMKAFLDTFPAKVKEYDSLIASNRIWLGRTKNVAVLSAEDAINFGCTGPVLRGSGVAYDIRKAEPYGVYDKVDWEVPIGKNGDTYDRYWIRMEEMGQSARIIAQCLDQLPSGAIMAEAPQYIPPPKELVMRDMESLIHHFIIYTQGIKPPKAETYCATEAPKGELGFFIVSDGSPRPYRMKIRSPSFVHMGAFDHMARGYLISDIITIFGTYDIVMGECDR